MKNPDRCVIPRCKSASFLTYMELPVCRKHWIDHCNGRLNLKVYCMPPSAYQEHPLGTRRTAPDGTPEIYVKFIKAEKG